MPKSWLLARIHLASKTLKLGVAIAARWSGLRSLRKLRAIQWSQVLSRMTSLSVTPAQSACTCTSGGSQMVPAGRVVTSTFFCQRSQPMLLVSHCQTRQLCSSANLPNLCLCWTKLGSQHLEAPETSQDMWTSFPVPEACPDCFTHRFRHVLPRCHRPHARLRDAHRIRHAGAHLSFLRLGLIIRIGRTSA